MIIQNRKILLFFKDLSLNSFNNNIIDKYFDLKKNYKIKVQFAKFLNTFPVFLRLIKWQDYGFEGRKPS